MSAVHYLPCPPPAKNRFENFKAQLPLEVAAVRHGPGGFFSLDFGECRGKDCVTAEAQYDWHLWIYMCDWDLFKGETRMLWRRESDNALAGAILAQLAGEVLTHFEYDEVDDCFTLGFSGGYRLHLDPDFYGFEPKDDLFMLFRHGEGDCLSYSPAKRFYRAA